MTSVGYRATWTLIPLLYTEVSYISKRAQMKTIKKSSSTECDHSTWTFSNCTVYDGLDYQEYFYFLILNLVDQMIPTVNLFNSLRDEEIN